NLLIYLQFHQLPDSGPQASFWQEVPLQRGGEWHRGGQRAYPNYGGSQVADALSGTPCCYFGPYPSCSRICMENQYATGLSHAGGYGLLVPRQEGTQVDDLGIDPHFVHGFTSPVHAHSVGNNGHVVTRAVDFCLPNFNDIVLLRYRTGKRPVQ